MQFTKAQRKKAKLRLALAGPAGSGKSWGALMIAKGLGGRIAVIDTERGSASLYSDLAEFDALELGPPFTPERYVEAIRAAERDGYDVLVIDSMTHEWNGSGGCLEINDSLAHARFKGNTWAAWNVTTPRHRAFVDAILQSPLHVVATIRSKTETVQGDDKKVRKVGMKSEQRDGTDYEFTLMLELEHERHLAVATKDRTRLFHDPHVIGPETGLRLREWLESGVEIPPEPSRMARHARVLEEADDLEALKVAFKAVNDDGGLAPPDKVLLTKLKDERKAALTTTNPTAAAVVAKLGGTPAGTRPPREPGIDDELFPDGTDVGVMR